MRGGYRIGSGKSKSGYYKGIYCGSTYELCWVIYSLDHNIKFSRFTKKLEQNGVVYYPDFLLDDNKTIIELKGYESQESVDRKTKVAESLGYNVIVLRENDLQYAFKYVIETYSTKKYYSLYDDYKPQYTYCCYHCKTSFSRDTKSKTDLVFCSRKCAGQYRKCIKTIKSQNGFLKINMVRSLTKEQALEIFNKKDLSLQQIADEYGVKKNTVWFIKQKKIYKWIHH